MKHSFLRRLGALALALALTLSLAVVPASAAVSVTISGENQLKVNAGTGTLTANVAGLPQGTTPTYQWSVAPNDADKVALTNDKTSVVTVTPRAEGTASITVTVSYPETTTDEDGNQTTNTVTQTATYQLTILPPDPTVTAITLNKTELTLQIDTTERLTVIPTAPENPIMGNITWTSSDRTVAVVDEYGNVTALKQGEATIHAETAGPRGPVTADCKVTVPARSIGATGISFSPNSVRIDPSDNGTKRVSVVVSPSTCTETVEWVSGDTSVVTLEVAAGSAYARTVLLKAVGPGETTVTARVKDAEGKYKEATLTVTVSGLVLLNPPGTMVENATYQLQYSAFGLASTTAGTVTWMSSDPSIVSVDTRGGRLIAMKAGTVTITLTKGDYTVSCQVTVQEDTSAVVNLTGTYNAGNPLVMSNVELLGKLDQISRNKTGSYLSYITNVSVPTSQGTLYYNYNSEANTGDGVGMADKFYTSANTNMGQAGMNQLTFVPNKSFTGTAEISYSGWSGMGESFSGVIRVTVNGISDGSGIFYNAMSGQPASFQADDFNDYCRVLTGRDLNYVVFSQPSTSTGTLYYNYTGQGQYGNKVSSSTQYSRTGNTNISNVSFVSAQGFTGSVKINFWGVNTAGTSFTGTVNITVTPSSLGSNPTDVRFYVEEGGQVTLRASEFNTACQSALGEPLSYVRFKLPASSQGTLYYNYRSGSSYDSRVDESTRYYYSGLPGIGNITFIPAANAAGEVAITYTGYGSSGATFTGTLYINLENTAEQTIRYSVGKGGLVAFRENDFNNVCLQQTGYNMDYVTFTSTYTPLGVLYYNYRGNNTYNAAVSSYTAYYRNPSYSYQNRLGYISFLAGSNAGTVVINYTVYAYTGNNTWTRPSVSGTVEIQIGEATPADITLNGTTASPVQLSSATIRSVCYTVMNSDLSYIQITSLPESSQGRLYVNYSGIGTGTPAQTNTKYYRAGSPGIDQLSFVPYGGFEGTATITYVGYSSSGLEQVSGQIKITITKATNSRYFNDISGYAWAADSVDFLYLNNMSDGVGGGRFGPSAHIRRGDFVLMLCRAFRFYEYSTSSFADVPANSYYAQAIATAKKLGIITGRNGSNYFYPQEDLTREDAMLMICNALRANGQTLTNGLTADLSVYSDQNEISAETKEAVGILVQLGIIEGDGNGHLRPKGTINRAEAAKILHHVLTL